MPQQLDSMVSTFRSGIEAKHLFDRLERAERFLMAVAVHQRFRRHGAERQLQAAGLRLAHQKFLEQQRMRADALGVVVRAQRKQFVAQRQQAARLQPDDRHAARGERRVGRDQPVQFARAPDRPGRPKGTSARSTAAGRDPAGFGMWTR